LPSRAISHVPPLWSRGLLNAKNLVRGTGLEPARLSPYAPQAYVSANSTTRARLAEAANKLYGKPMPSKLRFPRYVRTFQMVEGQALQGRHRRQTRQTLCQTRQGDGRSRQARWRRSRFQPALAHHLDEGPRGEYARR